VLSDEEFDMSEAQDGEYIANALSTIFKALGGKIINT